MDPIAVGVPVAAVLVSAGAGLFASWSMFFVSIVVATVVSWFVLKAKVPLVAELTKNWRSSVPFVGKDKVVLLTGATCPSGIGAQLALMYHDHLEPKSGGKSLILVGRKSREDLLKMCRASDASDTHARIEKMLCAASTLYLQVDLMQVNCGQKLAEGLTKNKVTKLDLVVQLHANAYLGPLAKQSEKSVQDVVNVNFRGTVLVTKHLLQFMDMKRKDKAQPSSYRENWEVEPKEKTAKFVFISSIASQCATPAFAVYSAVKCATDFFAWSLLSELSDSNIGVQLLHVCATDTGFFVKSGIPKGAFDTSKFRSPVKMAADLRETIDYSRNFRSTFGSYFELARFYVMWLLPPQWLIRYKVKSFFSGGPYNPGTGGFVRRKGAPRGGSGEPLRCIVTGGSQGIGKAICQEIVDKESRNGKGVEVLSFDVMPPSEKMEHVKHAKMDLSAGVTSIFEASIAEHFGKDKAIDVLINNAGINVCGRLDSVLGAVLAKQSWDPANDDHLAKMIAINFTSYVALTIATLNWNAKLGAASAKAPPAFVFVSSASHYFSYPGSCAYGATKDAVASFTKSLGFGFAGVTSVLTVYPGPTDTAQAAEASPHIGEKEDAAKKSRRSPKETAEDIWKSTTDGDTTLIPGESWQKMAKKASLDPVWCQNMMKAWQLDPLEAALASSTQ